MDYHLDYLSQDVVDLIDHYGREKASVSDFILFSISFIYFFF